MHGMQSNKYNNKGTLQIKRCRYTVQEGQSRWQLWGKEAFTKGIGELGLCEAESVKAFKQKTESLQWDCWS